MYLLTVSEIDKAALRSPELSGPALLPALQYGRKLAVALESTLLGSGWDIRDQSRRFALLDFLERTEPTVIVTLAGLVRRVQGGKTHPGDLPVISRKKLLEGLKHQPDVSVKPAQLIAYVETLRPDYRTRYNLACYWAGVEDDDRALQDLDAAVATAPGDVALRAAHDPTLEPLRKRKPEEFAAVLARQSQPRDLHGRVVESIGKDDGVAVYENARLQAGQMTLVAEIIVETRRERLLIETRAALEFDITAFLADLEDVAFRAERFRCSRWAVIVPDTANIPPGFELRYDVVRAINAAGFVKGQEVA
jgi:hypothetical protein